MGEQVSNILPEQGDIPADGGEQIIGWRIKCVQGVDGVLPCWKTRTAKGKLQAVFCQTWSDVSDSFEMSMVPLQSG